MSQPPPESGNVVDPEVLASRRARRAEVSEDASLELRLFEADRRLGEVAAERDALRAQIEGFERDLRGTRQREWSEQQQRLEAQGETAAARSWRAPSWPSCVSDSPRRKRSWPDGRGGARAGTHGAGR